MRNAKLTARTLKYMGVKSSDSLNQMTNSLNKFVKAGNDLREAYQEFESAYYLLGKGEDGKNTPELFIANAGSEENAKAIDAFKRGFWEWFQGQYGSSHISMAKDLLQKLK